MLKPYLTGIFSISKNFTTRICQRFEKFVSMSFDYQEKMSDSEKEQSNELYYIHLENLPWSAGHQDVLQFFHGISIPPGGISIFCKDAFVVVTNKTDSDRALAMSGKDIHGTTVYLTSSIKRDVFQRKCQYVSRKLRFSPPFKRLRPTAVPKTSKDVFSVFNPTETVISEENKEVSAQQPNKRKSKKIRPTLLKDLTQLQVFDESDTGKDGHCVKKMRLVDNWLLSHLEIV